MGSLLVLLYIVPFKGPTLVHWEEFPDGHVYYIPLSCMIPADADNIVAAGRCVDADSHALSAIRVMGPCIGMGTAAAHALSLAGSGPVADIDLKSLQKKLSDNLDGPAECMNED